MPLGEGAVQAVDGGLHDMPSMWRGASEGAEGQLVHSPDAQEQLHAVHRQARSKRYQQQGRVSEMNVEKLIIKRTEEGYELYADEVLLFKTDDADAVEAALEELYKGAQIVPYVKKPQ